MKFAISVVILICQSLFSTLLVAETKKSNPMVLTEILFEELEPGTVPYTSRLLINDQVMRLDDGTDDGDFILFHQNTQEIHSFNHEDQTHLIINPSHDQKIDFKIDFRVTEKQLSNAPKVGGKTVVEYHYYADAQLCKKSINAPEILPQVRQLLIDYENVLVRQNIATFSSIPAEMRNSCYMANNYLQASAYLKYGFPLRVIDDSGRQKKLLGFSEVSKPMSIMQPPSGYRVYYASLPEMNESN